MCITNKVGKMKKLNSSDWQADKLTRRVLYKTALVAMGLVCSMMAWPLAAAPFAYLANSVDNSVSVMDTALGTVSSTISDANFLQPYGVAVDPSGSRVYVTNTSFPNSRVTVINTASGTVVATLLDINLSRPRGIAINRFGTRAYVANLGSNTVSVIDTDPASLAVNTVIDTISGLSQPEGIAVHPTATPIYVYVANSNSTTVSVINTNNNTISATIAVGNQPRGIALNPAGTRAYVANLASNSLSVIDADPASGTFNTVLATVAGLSQPYGVAVSPDGSKVYVTNTGNDTVSVISTAGNSISATVTVGTQPKGIALNPAGTRAYVANSGNATVSIINTATDMVSSSPVVGTTPISLGNFMGPAVSASASSLAFGGVLVGSTSAVQTVTLANDGATPISLSAAISGDFAQTNPCGATLAAGASCVFSVSFTPAVAGSRSGTLTITSNAANSPHTVALSGTGTTASSGGGGGGGGGCALGGVTHDPVLLLLMLAAAMGLLRCRQL